MYFPPIGVVGLLCASGGGNIYAEYRSLNLPISEPIIYKWSAQIVDHLLLLAGNTAANRVLV